MVGVPSCSFGASNTHPENTNHKTYRADDLDNSLFTTGRLDAQESVLDSVVTLLETAANNFDNSLQQKSLYKAASDTVVQKLGNFASVNPPAPDPNAPAPDPNAPAPDSNPPAPDPNTPAPDPSPPAPDPNAPAPDPTNPVLIKEREAQRALVNAQAALTIEDLRAFVDAAETAAAEAHAEAVARGNQPEDLAAAESAANAAQQARTLLDNVNTVIAAGQQAAGAYNFAKTNPSLINAQNSLAFVRTLGTNIQTLATATPQPMITAVLITVNDQILQLGILVSDYYMAAVLSGTGQQITDNINNQIVGDTQSFYAAIGIAEAKETESLRKTIQQLDRQLKHTNPVLSPETRAVIIKAFNTDLIPSGLVPSKGVDLSRQLNVLANIKDRQHTTIVYADLQKTTLILRPLVTAAKKIIVSGDRGPSEKDIQQLGLVAESIDELLPILSEEAKRYVIEITQKILETPIVEAETPSSDEEEIVSGESGVGDAVVVPVLTVEQGEGVLEGESIPPKSIDIQEKKLVFSEPLAPAFSEAHFTPSLPQSFKKKEDKEKISIGPSLQTIPFDYFPDKQQREFSRSTPDLKRVASRDSFNVISENSLPDIDTKAETKEKNASIEIKQTSDSYTDKITNEKPKEITKVEQSRNSNTINRSDIQKNSVKEKKTTDNLLKISTLGDVAGLVIASKRTQAYLNTDPEGKIQNAAENLQLTAAGGRFSFSPSIKNKVLSTIEQLRDQSVKATERLAEVKAREFIESPAFTRYITAVVATLILNDQK